MKRHLLKFLAAAACTLLPVIAHAVPAQVQLQGVLQDSIGGADTASSTTLTFRVYDNETGGTVLHTETATVNLRHGHFSYALGSSSGSTLDLSIFDGNDRWISVQVTPDSLELEPRIAIGHVAHAALAGTADTVPWSGVTDVPPHVAASGGYTSGVGMRVDNTARTFGLQHTGCANGSMWVRTADTAQWVCQPLATSVTPGFGIEVDGREVSIDPTIIQRRAVNTSCPFGISVLSASGFVSCATNNDTNTNVFGRLCTDAGTILRGYTAEGQPICVPDQNTNVFGTACLGSAEFLQGFDINGQPICVTSTFVDTNDFGRQCSISGQVATHVNADGSLNCVNDVDTDTSVWGQQCASGSLLRGFDSNGNPLCTTDRNNAASLSAGAGITLSATTYSLKNTRFEYRSCWTRTCSNSSACLCNTDEFMVAWDDGGDDRTTCCQMWLPL